MDRLDRQRLFKTQENSDDDSSNISKLDLFPTNYLQQHSELRHMWELRNLVDDAISLDQSRFSYKTAAYR